MTLLDEIYAAALGEMLRDPDGWGFYADPKYDSCRAFAEELCTLGFAKSFEYGKATRYRITNKGLGQLYLWRSEAEADVSRCLAVARRCLVKADEVAQRPVSGYVEEQRAFRQNAENLLSEAKKWREKADAIGQSLHMKTLGDA